jgi:hypothetical protein
MDWLTWGLVFVLIVFFTARWVIEYRIYKNSVYKVIYENFTEYRIRKKSIEGMSESNVIKKMFGSGRLVYQVLDQRNLNPASFVVMILPGGFQIFGIAGKNKVGRDALKICGKFYAENVEKKLAQSVYAGKNIPVSFRVVLSDQENAAPAGKLCETVRSARGSRENERAERQGPYRRGHGAHFPDYRKGCPDRGK